MLNFKKVKKFRKYSPREGTETVSAFFTRAKSNLGNTVPERGRKPSARISFSVGKYKFRKYSPREGTETTIAVTNTKIITFPFRKYSPREGTETTIRFYYYSIHKFRKYSPREGTETTNNSNKA